MEKLFQQSMFAIGCRCIPVMEFITDNDTLEPMEDSKEVKAQKEFFEKLEDMRKQAKMTLRDMAKYFDMAPALYCKYRNGSKLLSDEDFAMFWVWLIKEQKRLESEAK